MIEETKLNAVLALALYMQRGFMSGKQYGEMGFPNMQSIIELGGNPDISDADAWQILRANSDINAFLTELQHGNG